MIDLKFKIGAKEFNWTHFSDVDEAKMYMDVLIKSNPSMSEAVISDCGREIVKWSR